MQAIIKSIKYLFFITNWLQHKGKSSGRRIVVFRGSKTDKTQKQLQIRVKYNLKTLSAHKNTITSPVLNLLFVLLVQLILTSSSFASVAKTLHKL